jgi:hypothetical protein
MNITFGKKVSLSNKANQSRVQGWVDRYKPQSEDPILSMVTEVECNEPNCAPIETLVILLSSENSAERWTGKILLPLSEVKEEDVESLLKMLNWGDINGKSISSTTANSEEADLITKIRSYLTEAEPIRQIAFRKTLLSLLDEFKDISGVEKKESVAFESSTKASVEKPKMTMVQMRPKVSEEEEVNKIDIINNTIANATATATATSAGSNNIIINEKNTEKIDNNSRETERKVNFSVKARKTGDFSEYSSGPPVRHSKGVRARGCPCCDPENIDNIVDKLLFMSTPP